MLQVSTNISVKDRKRMELRNFRGVDTANTIINVAKSRATFMRNFTNINGINRKRCGYFQKYKFDGAINGIFEFSLKNTNFLIIYAGKKFYLHKNETDTFEDITLYKTTNTTAYAKKYKVQENRLIDNKTEIFTTSDKAYFIGCGDFLVFGDWGLGWQLRRVEENEDVYIPTTTVGITAESNSGTLIKRTKLDEVNLLTGYRKNSLRGESVANSSFVLDTKGINIPIQNNNEITVELELKNGNAADYITARSKIPTADDLKNATREMRIGDTINSEITLSCRACSNDKTDPSKLFSDMESLKGRVLVKFEHGEIAWTDGCRAYDNNYLRTGPVETYLELMIQNVLEYPPRILGMATELTDNSGFYKVKITQGIFNSSEHYLGAVIEYDNDYYIGLFPSDRVIFNSYLPPTVAIIDDAYPRNEIASLCCQTGVLNFKIATTPTDISDNIIVTFSSKQPEKVEMIKQSEICTLFGVGGNANRLMLSGNKNYKNYFMWSAENDYTYFSDIDNAFLGSSNTAIVGFQKLSDETLAIYKEPSTQEPNIYCCRGSYIDKTFASGAIDKRYAVFPTQGAYISEGLINRHCNENLAGDYLIISKNGVFGVVVSANVASNERYARERSVPINKLLKQHKDISKSVVTVYDNKFYLALDGKCYIADARYKYLEEKDMDDTFNYEWWVWDNIPAHIFGEISGSLVFGTTDGRLCVFGDKYFDETYILTDSGDISANYSENNFTCKATLCETLNDGDMLHFETSVYGSLIDSVEKVESGKIYVAIHFLQEIFEGQIVYIKNAAAVGLVPESAYVIAAIDRGECCFSITTINGKAAIPSSNIFSIVTKLSDDYCISGKTTGSFKILEVNSAKEIKLVQYSNETANNIIIRRITRKNVIAEWTTPAFDLGANDYSKTLLAMTVSADQIIDGKLQIGYETRKINKMLNAQGLSVFDFNNIDFNNFSFQTEFASSYTRKIIERDFNYIMFKFLSDNDKDCAIHTLTATYKINKRNKGVN